MLVLRHLNAKPKAYRFVDTHAGAGGYSLEGRYAQKKGEYERGIGAALDARRPARAARRLRRAGARVQSRRRAHPVPRLAGDRADAAAPAGPAARLRAPSDRAEDPALDARPPTGARRSTTATASTACAPRCRRRRAGARGADRPELRRQRRLRQGRRHAARGARRASPRASTWSGIRRSASSRRRELPRRLIALAPKGWLHVRLTVQVPDRAGLRPRRQRRLRPQSAAHAARAAAGDAALSRRRARPVRRRELPARWTASTPEHARPASASARTPAGAAWALRSCAIHSLQSSGPDSKRVFRLPST